MILINITYQIATEESISNGEYSELGFNAENAEYTFRELVQALRDKFTNGSCSPVQQNIYTWFSSDDETNMRTGDTESESIHYSRDNPARKEKYWAKAIKASGLK